MLLLLTILLVCGCSDNQRGALEQTLSEALPAGASSERVIEYLDAARIEHSALTREQSDGPLTIRAIKRDTGRLRIVRKHLQIVFTFDDKSRLVRAVVKEGYTGP